MPVYLDGQGALKLLKHAIASVRLKHAVASVRLKHMNIIHHFARDRASHKKVCSEYCSTEDMVISPSHYQWTSSNFTFQAGGWPDYTLFAVTYSTRLFGWQSVSFCDSCFRSLFGSIPAASWVLHLVLTLVDRCTLRVTQL